MRVRGGGEGVTAEATPEGGNGDAHDDVESEQAIMSFAEPEPDREPGNGDGWRPKGIPAGVWQKMKDGGVVKGVRP